MRLGDLQLVPLPPQADPPWEEPSDTDALRARLETLEAERALSGLHDLGRLDLYRDQLDAHVVAARIAYTGAVVVELAQLRAALCGALQG